MECTTLSPNLKQCQRCGASLTRDAEARGRWPKFCADCATEKRRIPPVRKTCERCGRQYVAANRSDRRFCTGACRYAAQLEDHKKQAPESKRCERCGKEYMPNKLTAWKQRFCSDQCRRAVTVKLSPHWYTCRHCGKQYQAKAKDRNTCCSRECWYAWLRDNPQLGPEPAQETMPMPLCEVCGQPVSNRNAKLCGSDECAKAHYLRLAAAASTRDRSPRACKECGEVFVPEYGDRRQRYCSSICAERHNGRIGKAKRRAVERGVDADNIDPFAVCGYYKWTCYICGRKTPRSLRGTTDPLAPEVDHIVPLAKGGTHTWSNVACACRECNQKKHDGELGQLRLLVA